MKNHRNIPLSLAKKHQLSLAGYFERSRPEDSKTNSGPRRVISLQLLENYENFYPCFTLFNFPEVVPTTNWIEVQYKIYKKGFFLVSNEHNELEPSFCEIEHILISNDQDCHFYVMNWETICFNSHVHAYQIEPTLQWQIISTVIIESKSKCSQGMRNFNLINIWKI